MRYQSDQHYSTDSDLEERGSVFFRSRTKCEGSRETSATMYGPIRVWDADRKYA
jgi:hypothetical protein